MTDLTSGSLVVDGIDLSTLRPKAICARLNAVPQDACFLSASVRSNLQPPGTQEADIPDEKLIGTLRQVKLWNIVEENGGLDADFKDSIFSCSVSPVLLLRPSKVIVLDEFTSRCEIHSIIPRTLKV